MKTKLTIEKDWAYISLTPENDYEKKTLFIISGMENVSTNFEQPYANYWYSRDENKRPKLKNAVIKIEERPSVIEADEEEVRINP